MNGESEPAGPGVPPGDRAGLGPRRAIAALLWAVAAVVGGFFVWHALTWFDERPATPPERRRADGNSGHVQIDFGGQWMMGRMVVRGYARELYHRQRQWQVLRESYPVSDEAPVTRLEMTEPASARRLARPDEALRHDADQLMYWYMGADPVEAWKTAGGAVAVAVAPNAPGNPFLTAAHQAASADTLTTDVVRAVNAPAIGGALYPPVHAFFYAPLAAIDRPQRAYHVFQVVGAVAVVIAALGVKALTRGRIWWSVATILLFLYPGTRAGLDLGQNPTITLAIVIWGWALAARGYNSAGGAVWGLLAFKPVWGVAFVIVPLLMRRWRFCAAMVLVGGGLAAATLPFVGLQTWFDWLAIGNEATALYNVNFNWIHLSRDLHGIPRRILHDFAAPAEGRDTALANGLAWALWGAVFGSTVLIYLRHGDRTRPTGVGAAFLFFGAWLTCYRFMYYDALLTAVGCAVLFAEPARWLRTRVFGLSPVPQTTHLPPGRVLAPPPAPPSPLGPRVVGYLNSFPLTVVALLFLFENSIGGMKLGATLGFGYYARVTTGADGTTGLATPRVEADTGFHYPWETVLVFALWAWCGWRLIRGDERRPGSTV